MNVMPTTDPQLVVEPVAERLMTRFGEKLGAATIERIVADSVATLTRRGRTPDAIPLLAERFARDRLRAIERLSREESERRPAVLFLCVHNAGRSQMASGWARHLSQGQVDVFSAGSEPAEDINAAAVEAMRERGIDISREVPQPWADEIVEAVDAVITMGCGDACPVLPNKQYLDWALEDPAGRGIEDVRPIRDDIERRVVELLLELGVDVGPIDL